MKYHILFNPTSNRGRAGKRYHELVNVLEEENLDYTIEFTLGKEGTIKQVEEALRRGVDVVVAAGGDGTINEVVNGLKGRGILGIIPLGRGNDIAISYRIPRDIRKAVKLLKNGIIKEVDIGLLDGRYFVGIAGTGFVGDVNYNSNKLNLTGFKGYLISVFTTLKEFKYPECEVSFDGISWKGRITLIALGNTSYYGGGMKLLPTSDPEDGYFDVGIAQKIHPIELILTFPLVYLGKHTINPHIKIYRGREVRIASDQDLIISFDGEMIVSKEIKFTNVPKFQKVIRG
ncbi:MULTISPECIES: diacylglycerol/lipid kinase family protein [Dictyoglomus]|uniref:Diacylglycerol kinase catalytic region n=1 Tax=Dictyoglomus turgidum (strain DSM 6724 / Z-1310) TaxID=515635 RepID=B8E2N9_DICTD|nr:MULTISPECIES: diacylglycerol kinase family protein [Dictyoglomus]ACK42883.1 diacylglycerol kinase catalytic region [Dictyoglomus turgidum DSM 6724]HBU30945.1 diacylglycerol kinase family lipid kinase [Dictyoglomus sp.]